MTVKQESILNERDTLSEEKHHLLDEIEKLRVEMAEKNHVNPVVLSVFYYSLGIELSTRSVLVFLAYL